MRSRRAIAAFYIALLGCGLTWLACSRLSKVLTKGELLLCGVGLVLGLLKPVARAVTRFSRWLDALLPRRHAVLVAGIAILISGKFFFAALRGHRPLVPLMHDEQMYLLQARQLASGHLAMPALPLGEFFDTFYVLVKPVYASMYFPGTALAYVPSIWLHLPFVAWPLLIMTGLCVITYLVASKLLGRLLGLVAVFAVLAAPPMNWMPTATMSHPLGGLLGMTVLYAWLRWRKTPRLGWAILLGTAAGWMAITRPMESLAFCLPVAGAIAWSVTRATLARDLRHAAVAIACTLPFISLQLATNHAVTGRWSQLPMTLYIAQEFPGVSTLGSAPTDFKSLSTLPQKQAMMRAFVAPMLNRLATENKSIALVRRTALILGTSVASPLFFLLFPFTLPALRRLETIVLIAIFVGFSVVYAIYGSYFQQYSSQIMSVLAIIMLLGVKDLQASYPSHASSILAACALSVVGVTLAVLLIMPNNAIDESTDWRSIIFNYQTLPNLVKKPALVMIRFGPKSAPFVEPVYNLEAAWPDDCPIIRAHDFGADRNQTLYRYYAAIQPERNVYLFDRDSGDLHFIGTAADLAAAAPTTQR